MPGRTRPTVGIDDTKPGIPRLALGPEEAARALGVSRDFLDEHIAGELRWVWRGRRKLVAVAELERWLDEAARTPEPWRWPTSGAQRPGRWSRDAAVARR
jgi:hypothetical protein